MIENNGSADGIDALWWTISGGTQRHEDDDEELDRLSQEDIMESMRLEQENDLPMDCENYV